MSEFHDPSRVNYEAAWTELNGPQKIFNEVLEDVVIIRKQDNKLGIGKTVEELKAMRDAFVWEKMSGIQPAERGGG